MYIFKILDFYWISLEDLRKVQTSECGCTVPKWPDKPLSPSDTDTLKINFVAENQGAFRKSLSIFANTVEGPFIITISGFAVR